MTCAPTASASASACFRGGLQACGHASYSAWITGGDIYLGSRFAHRKYRSACVNHPQGLASALLLTSMVVMLLCHTQALAAGCCRLRSRQTRRRRRPSSRCSTQRSSSRPRYLQVCQMALFASHTMATVLSALRHRTWLLSDCEVSCSPCQQFICWPGAVPHVELMRCFVTRRSSGADQRSAGVLAAPAGVLPASGRIAHGIAPRNAGRPSDGLHQSAGGPCRPYAVQSPPRGGRPGAPGLARPGMRCLSDVVFCFTRLELIPLY